MDISPILMVALLACIRMSLSEWVVKPDGLPKPTQTRPDEVSVLLTWKQDNSSDKTNILLSLAKSSAVPSKLPMYTMEGGVYKQTALLNMKHSTFYHDLLNRASISLTSFAAEEYALKGSFVSAGEVYDIEPFHAAKHKRSLGAKHGDHIITRRAMNAALQTIDYIEPAEGSRDYNTMIQANQLKKQRKKTAHVNKGKERVKRQSLPATTYIVQLYLVVDFYLYQTLLKSSMEVNWAPGVDDYISFFMGHQANEIDIRYRNIDSSVPSVGGSWTIGTKLSYLHVAKTAENSAWTHPPTDAVNLKLNSSAGLDKFNTWVATEPGLPSDADHYMLITSLDLTSNAGSGNAGLAFVSGTCGDNPTSINEFGGTGVYAHELGHNLGASHDGTDGCNADDHFVMAPSLGVTTADTRGNTWKFSDCSVSEFDAFITTLTNQGRNCLTNSGSYVSTWADDFSNPLAQAMTLDEQCRLIEGESYSTYTTSKFSEVCSALWCTQDGTLSATSSQAAFPYTTCGNKKWCVEEVCVSDPAAPELDESCPFGDHQGRIFSNSDRVCADITASTCQSNSFARGLCCEACPALETPWLGPTCPYGDTLTGCEVLTTVQQCSQNAAGCCEHCCTILGPAEGYSCSPPSTTTSSTTTSVPTTTTPITTTPTTTTSTTTTPTTTISTTTTPTTTTPTTTTSTTTTPTTTTSTTTTPTTTAPTTTTPTTTTSTTTTPTTTTSTTTTPTTNTPTTTTPTTTTPTTTTPTTTTSTTTTPATTTSTTTTPTTTTSTTTTPTTTTSTTTTPTTNTPTTTTPTTTTPTTTTPTTTTVETTTTTVIVPTTTQKRSGVKKRRFKLVVRIDRFLNESYQCNDTDLQISTSATYRSFSNYICKLIQRYVRKSLCPTRIKVSCGSLILETVVVVEEDDADAAAVAAPATAEQFLQQISGIQNAPDLVVTNAPTVEDFDECSNLTLNDCSPNAACTNTDGFYTCSCSSDFPVDLSEFADQKGRVCAKSCDMKYCPLGEICEPVAETEPTCICPDGFCNAWFYGLVGAAAFLGVLVIIIIITAMALRSKKQKRRREREMTNLYTVPSGSSRHAYSNPAMYMESSLSGKRSSHEGVERQSSASTNYYSYPSPY